MLEANLGPSQVSHRTPGDRVEDVDDAPQALLRPAAGRDPDPGPKNGRPLGHRLVESSLLDLARIAEALEFPLE